MKSDYFEKLARGESVTEEDWNRHLLDSHRRAPSQTPEAFGDYESFDGRNSYQRLADVIRSTQPKPKRVLDLACGDGHLIPFCRKLLDPDARILGVDMSEDELSIAKRRHTSEQISFFQASGQRLPLEDRSIDLTLCHMAFMLMMPLEPVVAEIGRVLKPGGRFAATIGNGAKSTGLCATLLGMIQTFVKNECPQIASAKSGDPRVRSMAGLEELFSRAEGFTGTVETEAFELQMQASPDALWSVFKNMYHVVMIPEVRRETLKSQLIAAASSQAATDGRVLMLFPMLQFSAFARA
jgi:ubiquinone/menaquinone biosynthesis C-methylase UbiE